MAWGVGVSGCKGTLDKGVNLYKVIPGAGDGGDLGESALGVGIVSEGVLIGVLGSIWIVHLLGKVT